MPSVDQPKMWIRTTCRANGLTVDDSQLDLLERYVRELLDANKELNLISRKDEEHVWDRHILHSISILFMFSFPLNARVVDVGSGGGLPGIPLKIMRPDLHMTLVDATRKKIGAASKILQLLDIKGVAAIWGRVEETARTSEAANTYDFAVARGVAPLAHLIQWLQPLLTTASSQPPATVIDVRRRPMDLTPPALIAMKGGEIGDEVRKAERLKRSKEISQYSLNIRGVVPAGFEDKKIVLVRF